MTKAELVDEIAQKADLPEPDPTLHRTRLWAHPAWGGILLLLMVIFWTGRKVIGAV